MKKKVFAITLVLTLSILAAFSGGYLDSMSDDVYLARIQMIDLISNWNRRFNDTGTEDKTLSVAEIEKNAEATKRRLESEDNRSRITATLTCRNPYNGTALEVFVCLVNDVVTDIEITANNQSYTITGQDLAGRRIPRLSSGDINISDTTRFSFTMPRGAIIRAQNSSDVFILELKVRNGEGNILYSDEEDLYGVVSIENDIL